MKAKKKSISNFCFSANDVFYMVYCNTHSQTQYIGMNTDYKQMFYSIFEKLTCVLPFKT